MIRIEQVKINNFRNFDGEYKFDFSKDVTIFLGDNGNGKSSIFDAIQWCLTGSIERFNDIPNLETLKNVLINKNTNDCFVEIKFTDNTILKRIISRKGQVLVRCLDANNNSIKSDKNVKQYLEKAFKATSSSSFDVNNFMKSSLLAQDQVLDFIASDSANERYKVLSSILGMDDITSLKTNYEQVKNILKIEIDKKYNLVTSRKEELKLQKSNIDNKYTNINIEDSNNFNIKDKQTEKDRLLENKFQAERNLKEFNSQAKNIDKYIEDLNLISENISTLKSKNQELQNQQEKIMKVLVLNKKDLKENDKFIQQVKIEEDLLSKNSAQEEELKNIESQLSNSDFNKLTSEPDKDVRNKMLHLYHKTEEYKYALKYIDDFNELSKLGAQIPKDIQKLKQKIKQISDEIQTLKNQKGILQSEFLSISSTEKLDPLIQLVQEASIFVKSHHEFENSCPVCKQTFPQSAKEFDNRLSHLLQESNVTVEKLSNYRNKIQELEETISNKQKQSHIFQSDLSQRQKEEREVKDRISTITNDLLYLKVNFNYEKNQLSILLNSSESRIKKREQYLELKMRKSNIERKLEEDSDIEFSGLNLKTLLEEKAKLEKIQVKNLTLEEQLKLKIEKQNKDLAALKDFDKLLNVFSNHYKVKNYNDILKHLSYVIDEKDRKINSITREMNNYHLIIEYSTLKNDLEEKEKSIFEPQKSLEYLKTKLQLIDRELNRINNAYSFDQIINSNESTIQQYFNYLNPNVSSYRNLNLNIDDKANTLDIEIIGNNKSVKAVNVLSSGQLNVLAISIFIAKNISQSNSLIDFIAIDDPIQNMDDINQFSMIDILSQLKKQVIFTTHDAKYVNLFLKKNELRLDDISVYYLDSENNSYENILDNN